MKHKRGRPRLDNKFHLILVRVTDQQNTDLREMSDRTKISVSAIMRLALDQYFKHKKPQDKDWEPIKEEL